MLEFEPEDETPFPHKEITEAFIGFAFAALLNCGRYKVECKRLTF